MGPETSTASERELNSITDETRRRTKSARSPTDKAVVLCTDERSQIQALDRTQPSLPMVRGRAIRDEAHIETGRGDDARCTDFLTVP